MPLVRRRRPLLRAAAVGGGAYYMGKRRAEAQEYEARGEQAPEAPAETGGGLSPEVLDRLKQLGSLKDQGILTEQEFAEQKAKLLAG